MITCRIRLGVTLRGPGRYVYLDLDANAEPVGFQVVPIRRSSR